MAAALLQTVEHHTPTVDHSCGQLRLPLSGILLSFDGIELESGSVDS